MSKIKDKFAEKLPQIRSEIQQMLKDHGSKSVSEVTFAQMFGGMRGVKSLLCETSYVDPIKGLIIRSIPILELADKLPEEIYWLLLTGELPTEEETKDFQAELAAVEPLQEYIWKAMKALPGDTHPMAMLSLGIMCLEKDSQFRRRYNEGMTKFDYWEPALEDSIRLLAQLPELAAGIYRIHSGKGDPIPPKAGLDWGGNYAHMLGISDPTGEFADLIRLYLVLHSDHESGNVSAMTTHVVASALSDAYYAVSAGLNGLAGPLHGLANQECLNFVQAIEKKYNGVPSDDDLRQFCWDTLNSGKVIPGYGHAVLRETDPCFTAFHQFGLKHCQDSVPFKIVDRLFAVVPDVLKEQGKAKNPFPNVDAGSGSLLYHYGLTEFDYYTVLFGVSRAMGMLSQMVYSRAVGSPIFRPKSVSLNHIREIAGA